MEAHRFPRGSGAPPGEGEPFHARDFHLLADAMPHIVWTAEPGGAISWFNRRWYEFSGLTREESLGWGWRSAWVAGSGEESERTRTIAAGRPWGETVSLRSREGEARRFFGKASPVRDVDGTLVGWVGTGTDIEDQMQARDELERLFELVPDILCVGSLDGRILRVNPAFERATGWRAGEVSGTSFFDMVHPDDVAVTREALDRLLDGAAIVPFENRFRTRCGEYRLLSWSARSRPSRGMAYAAAKDVTEARAAAASLEAAADFADRFVGIVAHDLRNPLASIASAAGLIQRTEGIPERAGRLASGIASTALRMGKMISDLMDFTRSRLGRGMPIDREPVELRALVREVVHETAVAYPERRLTLEADAEVRGEWDGTRLAQVVGNLLKNALDYSPTETPVSVSVLAETEGGRLRFQNQNRAGAVPPDRLSGACDPFRPTAEGNHGRPHGLGLGLYIAREIVLAHGGTIEAASDDRGTTFDVWLPLRPAE